LSYYEKNRDHLLAESRKYYRENKPAIQQRQREWREKNKDRLIIYRRNQYLKTLETTGKKVRQRLSYVDRVWAELGVL